MTTDTLFSYRGVSLKLSNDADLHAKPSVVVGVPATLNFRLVNETGADILLHAGAKASQMTIYLPAFFDLAGLERMTTDLAGWTLSVDAEDPALRLLHAGAEGTPWSSGDSIAFRLSHAASAAAAVKAQYGSVQISFSNCDGVRAPATAPLVLCSPHAAGNASLTDVLELTLDDGGIVYISPDQDDLLANTLTLNIKNKGAAPVYAGSRFWTGDPTVTVGFVYGRTQGALAPDDDPREKGSVWSIAATALGADDNPWRAAGPTVIGGDRHPVWTLQPDRTGNRDIIGVGESANVQLRFDNVYAPTPAGHSQMALLFSGFAKDDDTVYDDCVFVVDIVKRSPPETRGVLKFAGPRKIAAGDGTVSLPIAFRWTLLYAAQVELYCDRIRQEPLFTRRYSDGAPMINDAASVSIPAQAQSVDLTFNLLAKDDEGGELDSKQFAVSIEVPVAIVSFTGKLLHAPGFAIALSWLATGVDQCSLLYDSRSFLADVNDTNPLKLPPTPLEPLRPAYTLLAGSPPNGKSARLAVKWAKSYSLATTDRKGLDATRLAVSPDGDRIFVLNSSLRGDAFGSLTVIDLHAKRRICESTIGDMPSAMVMSPNGKRLYVATQTHNNHNDRGSVLVFDCQAVPPTVLSVVLTPSGTFDLAISADGSRLFASGGSVAWPGTVVMIDVGDDAANPKVLSTVPVGVLPTSIALAREGSSLFVANLGNACSVTQIAVGLSLIPVRTIASFSNCPQRLAATPDGRTVYAFCAGGGVYAIDASTDTATASPIGLRSTAFAIVSPDGHHLYDLVNATNRYAYSGDEPKAGHIATWDLSQTPPVESPDVLELGGVPFGMAASADGVTLYATYRDPGTLSGALFVASPASIG